MSETTTVSSHPLADKSKRDFLLRKLQSLTGVAPVGLFLCFHLYTNAQSLYGQERFDTAVQGISHMAFLPLLELGIFLPLAFHALLGVKIAIEGRGNLGAYPYGRNWMYMLQRVTGIIAFAFIVWHVMEYRGAKFMGQMSNADFYPSLSANLSSRVGPVPLEGLLYLLGVAACAFHLANGLWGFCCSWGLTVTRRSQRASATVFGLLGIGLFAMGALTVIHFATGMDMHWLGGTEGAMTSPALH